MPNYNFICKNCGDIELFMQMAAYDEFKCRCPQCQNKLERNYGRDIFVARDDSSGMTLGTFAERATAKLSDDEKAHKHYEQNKYKYETPSDPLPEGMSYGKEHTNGKLK